MIDHVHGIQIPFFEIDEKSVAFAVELERQDFFYDKVLGFLFERVEHSSNSELSKMSLN